ncbi:hypothetical protein RM780_15250 [Streptomyces sp. DSM 44917]|uniref:FXSXX-COOH protein n=1 Tax=Streptomyces boetiae TaxID=3075541 RepID=A0ABU2LAK0_9ACTN|nr:hypothetical protein [Streptomyces sp. DSM 44917]MDT0308308.1 hypothetical protein [Streptomyces sp. DSM 44917]
MGDGREPLPDLLGFSLTELRDLDHPVLSEVLAELRERVTEPAGGGGGGAPIGTLMGFNQFDQYNESPPGNAPRL